jgi:hypothetical protein
MVRASRYTHEHEQPRLDASGTRQDGRFLSSAWGGLGEEKAGINDQSDDESDNTRGTLCQPPSLLAFPPFFDFNFVPFSPLRLRQSMGFTLFLM